MFNTAKDNTNDNGNGIPANKQAVGFLNFYLPNTGGGKRKLGSIPLRKAYKNEKDLAAWIVEDPSRIAIILSKLVLEYNAVESATGFDLGDAPAAQPPVDPKAPKK